MKKIYAEKWNSSYSRHENFIFFPKEEVIKFLNRFVRKKIESNKFQNIIPNDNLKGLDYGCGIGANTWLMHEFNIDGFGIDISETAINNARKIHSQIESKFSTTSGNEISFPDNYFDLTICDSVLDSMHLSVAKNLMKEIERVTKELVFVSFISGNDSKFSAESTNEEILSTIHENGTVQNWFNWEKILSLIADTKFEVKWARLMTEKSLIDENYHGRYNIILKKIQS
jgi:ubiquinone/menaquinone biosynthesis C-methylase UbiE